MALLERQGHMSWLLFLVIFAYRLLISLTTLSYHDPDEHWQSLEIAHLKVFGYGYCTWEWRQRIRSSAFPWIFVAIYSLLRRLHLDQSHYAMWVMPKIVMSLSSAWADRATFLFAQRLSQSTKIANWTLVASLFSSFHFIYATRTLSNSLEMAFTAAALSYFPWHVEGSSLYRNYQTSLVFAGAACLVRPTNALLCAFLLPLLLLRLSARQSLRLALVSLATMCAFVLGSLYLDFLFYGEWVVTSFRFFYLNVAQNISAFYGIHSFFWYFYSGLPFLLVAWTPFFVLGCCICPRKDVHVFVFGSMLALSLLGHKEFRFLYPLLPAFLVLSGYGLARAGALWPSVRDRWLFAILVLHVGLGLFLNRYHNCGPLAAIEWLRKDIQAAVAHHASSRPHVFFLTPCHAAPYYASLHFNVTLDFLTCDPPISGASNRLQDLSLLPLYEDEADSFYAAPDRSISKLVLQLFPSVNYLVLFESLYVGRELLFTSAGFEVHHTLFNAYFHPDSRRRGYMMILKRTLRQETH